MTVRAVRHHAILITAALGASTAPLRAQVADSVRPPVFRAGEISVQAARPVTTAGGASALEVQLDSMRLAPAPTLEQVLRELPLVQVRTNSRGEAQFSLRGSGSDARQVAVLVDGVPLNLGWDDRADLSGELQVVGFHRDLAGAIERVAVAGGRFQRVNLGAVRSSGIELMGSTRLGPAALGADLTLQRVRAHGAVAAGHPEYQPGVLAGVNARWDMPLALRAGRHLGPQYCAQPDAAGELRLDASRRFDGDVARNLRLRRAGFGAHVELRAAVDNALDAAIYDQCGLPQAGRTLRLQARIR